MSLFRGLRRCRQLACGLGGQDQESIPHVGQLASYLNCTGQPSTAQPPHKPWEAGGVLGWSGRKLAAGIATRLIEQPLSRTRKGRVLESCPQSHYSHTPPAPNAPQCPRQVTIPR